MFKKLGCLWQQFKAQRHKLQKGLRGQAGKGSSEIIICSLAPLNPRPLEPYVSFCLLSVCLSVSLFENAYAFDLPRAAWRKGDISSAQENSRKSITSALESPSPNIEVDVIDFTDNDGKRTGILSNDYNMKRLTGEKGDFIDHHDISKLPPNHGNKSFTAEGFLSVIDLFDIIKERKKDGITPHISIDMKEEGESGYEFGKWLGTIIKEYGFQEHIFLSSFYKTNVEGVESSCPECLTGGIVFTDHWALKRLGIKNTILDVSGVNKATFFMGIIGKKEFLHDFVLIQDDVIFSNSEVIDYWRDVRKVKFIGGFVHNKERTYTDIEWKKLEKIDWLELDPTQMSDYIKAFSGQR